jgi:hypothetical protein
MRVRPRLTTLASLSLGVAVLGACGSARRSGPAGSASPPLVIFENQSLSEAAVFVVPRGGSRVRIGTVQPGRTDTLRVQTSALGGSGSVTIIARLLTLSRTPSTGPISLLPGDRIAVTLPSDARILSVLPVRE